MDIRFITCGQCSGEGRLYCGYANDPHPRYVGPCKACGGTGMTETEVLPITMEDLDAPA